MNGNDIVASSSAGNAADYDRPLRLPPTPAEWDALRAEVEQLRVQLAGCLTAAEGFTKDPAKHGDYGWSVSYQKTLELRLAHDSTLLQIEDMKKALDAIGYARLVDDGAPPCEEIREARNIARVTLARYTK